jgi:spoIIIJ-associated protein
VSEHEAEPEGAPPEQPAEASGDLLDDQADAAEDFIHGLLDVLDMDGQAEADIIDETIEIRVNGPDMALLIGRHGATLEALQELTRAAVQHQTTSGCRLVLDIEGYRERQREMLERRARSAAARARKTRRPVSLDPMSSFERKVIHTALADFDGVHTASEGEEPDRKVVIYPG